MSWCCRPCRCGVIVHTDDGRDPANACLHGEAICGDCAPGDCDDCRVEKNVQLLTDLLEQVLATPDPWDNGRRVDINFEDARDPYVEPLYVQRKRDAS